MEVASELLRVGGAALALHIRGPRTGGARLFDLAESLLPVALEAGALLVANDRVDIALALGLRGVQLGSRSLPVSDVRRIVGRSVVVGVSCHSARDVAGAAVDGADYAFLGNVFSTPTHPGVEGLGAPAFSRVVARSEPLPVVAIGGVTVSRIPALMAAGAHGLAVQRGIWDAQDPVEALKEYISGLAAFDEQGSR